MAVYNPLYESTERGEAEESPYSEPLAFVGDGDEEPVYHFGALEAEADGAAVESGYLDVAPDVDGDFQV